MTLPASGVITLNEIVTEFGGTYPASLSQYYRGGARVPNTSANANIPTTGIISLNNFYGASAVVPLVATLQMGAGASGNYLGFSNSSRPIVIGNIGSISTATFNGYTFCQIVTTFLGSSFELTVALSASPTGYAPQNAFNQVTFKDFNNIQRTFATASANYINQAGTPPFYTAWSWAGQTQLFINGGTYSLVFT